MNSTAILLITVYLLLEAELLYAGNHFFLFTFA